MNRRVLRLISASLCLFVASCASPEVASLSWNDVDGRKLTFFRVPSGIVGEEGHLEDSRPVVFALSPARVVPAPSCLELEFRQGPKLPVGDLPEIEIAFSGQRNGTQAFLRERFTLRNARSRLVLPLAAGTSLASLSISLLPREKAAPDPEAAYRAEIISIREIPPWSGIQTGEGWLRISGASSAWRKDGQEHAAFSLAPGFPPLYSEHGGIVVSYGPGGGGKYLSILTDGKPGLEVRLHPAGLATVLPYSMLPSVVASLELVLPPGVAFRAFAAGILASDGTGSIDAATAELADFGRILRTGAPTDGREFDLYRWDLLPDVLIFDFRDYAVQDSWLKRLAFFVEKDGFRGSLALDAEIAGLHGWNAHDYRPSDLAAFFEKARRTGFVLGERELLLRDILLARGILVQDGKAFVEGKGAIISITRESEPYLRMTFLNHESTHAIFFADAAYRAFVKETWTRMDKEEKWFWRLYFGWMNYDTGDDYLMANEYQAYLLQQTLKQVEPYFTKTLTDRLTEKHPELKPRLDEYMEKYRDSFGQRAGALDAWLEGKYGFRAGFGASY